MKIDVFTLFPEWFGWFREQRHVRNALQLEHTLELVNFRESTPLRAGHGGWRRRALSSCRTQPTP